MFAGGGVLTPYVNLTLYGSGARHLKFGGQLKVASSLNIQLESEHRDVDENPNHSIMLEGALNW